MERMSSQNWLWPESPCSWIRAPQFSRSGRPKRGNLESCGGKNVRARLGPFHLNWLEPVFLIGQTGQMENDLRQMNLLEFSVYFAHRAGRGDYILDENIP